LQNLFIHLEKRGPQWLGFAHRLDDRALNQVRVYRALDPQQLAELPLRTEATRSVREPDVSLSPRQRKDPLSQVLPQEQFL
jgi:hypothetical protein